MAERELLLLLALDREHLADRGRWSGLTRVRGGAHDTLLLRLLLEGTGRWWGSATCDGRLPRCQLDGLARGHPRGVGQHDLVDARRERCRVLLGVLTNNDQILLLWLRLLLSLLLL